MSALSGLGIFDRILGFVFGASKFFLIAAVIAFAVSNVKALKPTLNSAFANSVLFPVLVETGGFIMKIDPSDVGTDLNASVKDATQKVSNTLNETKDKIVDSEVNKTVQEIKKQLKEEK